VGASDIETIDGYHGSEKAYLRLFLEMNRRSSRLSEWAEESQSLEQRLAACNSDYTVFENDEYQRDKFNK
jgi:hypothetical protein